VSKRNEEVRPLWPHCFRLGDSPEIVNSIVFHGKHLHDTGIVIRRHSELIQFHGFDVTITEEGVHGIEMPRRWKRFGVTRIATAASCFEFSRVG